MSINQEDFNNANLEAALGHARRGWRVIPVHNPVNDQCSCGDTTCKAIGKHPRISDWVRKATTEEPSITGWWQQFPDANVGIVTGKASNLVVIDVDTRHDGEKSLEKLSAIYA